MGMRLLGAAVWVREHLGAGRLGAVLIKNRHSAKMEARLMKKS